ncbi:IclR family transcriptional regulator [Candidatus Pantoea deserta]|uniref:IclR family transcriptional regulator n=1 Tax=Candidatus Pantoea deserta TaxID=1869313 RepID=A0A3N4P5E8_9GAMM|nr:IclR family transcriptional regulator [Pantoea deserta]RPD94653.1 IclR family transcriptional regulator [Pantoea deserta]
MGNEGVVAVEKALSLLDCFKPGEESLTLTALAQASGQHKTTVYRLMNSLERMHYVIRRENGCYSLGPRLLYLGKLYEQSFHLAHIVQPELHALAASTGESASWYIIEEGQRLCLFRAESSEGLRETRLAGSSLPLDNSAIGQVLRYWGLREPLFDRPPELPLYTAGIRDPHIAALSLPVFGEGDTLAAALAITGPVSRLTPESHKTGVTRTMQDTASRLSLRLGASKSFCDRFYPR